MNRIQTLALLGLLLLSACGGTPVAQGDDVVTVYLSPT